MIALQVNNPLELARSPDGEFKTWVGAQMGEEHIRKQVSMLVAELLNRHFRATGMHATAVALDGDLLGFLEITIHGFKGLFGEKEAADGIADYLDSEGVVLYICPGTDAKKLSLALVLRPDIRPRSVTINEVCVACGMCVDVCPVGAISAADPIYLLDQYRCTLCMDRPVGIACVPVCPIEAFTMKW